MSQRLVVYLHTNPNVHVNMMSGDEELGQFLDGMFDENETDEYNCYTQRSKQFIIHGEKKRLRLSEYVSVDLFKDIETTLANIGASDGATGEGVLFKKSAGIETIETKLFELLTFAEIAKYTLLQHFIAKQNISLVDWLAFWKKIGDTRPGRCTNDVECTSVFRFNTACSKICLSKTCKEIADAFHDSMHQFGLVVTRHRGTGGLVEFAFPGCSSVSAARKKLYLLLHGEDRLEFCNDQISGKQINIDACLQAIRCSSPDDVAYEQELSIFPLGCTGAEVGEEVVVDIEDAKIVTEPPLKKRCSEASRSREGSRTETYLKERAEKAEREAREKDSQLEQLREQLAALKVARETPQAVPQDIGIKIDEDDSDDDSVTSAERERYLNQLSAEQEKYEHARDQREIQQFGMDGHEQRKRRRLSKYDAAHVFTFLEFRNAYRTMREKRNIEIEFIVWLKVFMFSAYFAATEYGAVYVHEHEIIPSLDVPSRMQGNSFLIYIGIFICAGVMLLFFAFNEPTACDWFYGLAIMPATRLCFDSNQGYASMIIIVLLCSQKIKWLLALEFVGVVVFVVMAPLANRFIFIGRLLLTMVFYQNRLVNHLDQRTPTIFLSVWRELILTLMFVVHFVIDKVQLFFCGCAGHE